MDLRFRLPLLIAGAALAAATAHAEPAPVFVPQRDVTIDYAITPQGRGPQRARVAVEAGAAHLRIDSDAAPGAVLLNKAAGTAVMTYPPAKMYVELPGRRFDVAQLLDDAHPQFTRTGQAVVAGLPCTEYRIVARQGSGTGCLTPDGVLLRGSGVDAQGRGGSLTATSVRYGALPASDFAPPPDYRELPRGALSALLPGFKAGT